jgi:hypothetical protein
MLKQFAIHAKRKKKFQSDRKTNCFCVPVETLDFLWQVVLEHKYERRIGPILDCKCALPRPPPVKKADLRRTIISMPFAFPCLLQEDVRGVEKGAETCMAVLVFFSQYKCTT